jgi:hypothetical protein
MPGLTPLLLLISLAVPGAEEALFPANSDLLKQAEDAFRHGVESQERVQQAQRHFTRAAELFRQLHERGVRSDALYLNLGNAEYLAGRPERALWAYQCGLLLNPNERRLREHLELARARIQYPPGGGGLPEPDFWPLALPRPTPRQTLAGAGIAYALTCLVATLWWHRRGRQLLFASFILLACAASGLLLWGWLTAGAEYERAHPLLVVSKETPLYRGNGPNYPSHPDLPALPRGLEARQLLRRGAWLQVQLGSGEIGWLPAAVVLVVDPIAS